MSLILIGFAIIVVFLIEKRNKTYMKYGDVSIAEEKSARAQKVINISQLSWVRERTGTTV